METIRHAYRVDRRQINMIKFIFEGYEGVASVTTLDASSGHISVASAPGCEDLVKEIMAAMANVFIVEPCGTTPVVPKHI